MVMRIKLELTTVVYVVRFILNIDKINIFFTHYVLHYFM